MRPISWVTALLVSCGPTPRTPDAGHATGSDAPSAPTAASPSRTTSSLPSTQEPDATKPARTRSPPEGPCPPGMPPVEGGRLTERQATQLAKIDPKSSSAVPTFCLQRVPATINTNDVCVRDGWCQPSPTFLLPCLRSGVDVLGRTCDFAANQPYFAAYGDIPFDHTPDVAEAYCKLQGWRLPTVQEWLWAAGGGEADRKYPWGDQPPSGKRLNAADPTTSLLTCDSPDIRCPKGKETTAFALLREEDGYAEVAPVGSYPAGAGRWGHLDLIGNEAQVVKIGDGFALCGGDNGTYKREEIALHEKPCRLCAGEDEGECKGAIRCVAEPVSGAD